jgi:ABC-2 type transport system permease protein
MRSMPRHVRRRAGHLVKLSRLGAAATLAQPGLLVARCVIYLLLLAVLSSFWEKVTAERLSKTLVARLPTNGLAVYIGVTEWITLSIPAIHFRFEDDIRSGAIEAQLLQPGSYLVSRVAESVGSLIVRLIVLGLVGLGGLVLWRHDALPWHAYAFVAFTGLLAGVIGILVFSIIGLTTFWVRHCLPILIVIQKMGFLLGGLFAPITLYPGWLQRLSKTSPFAAQFFLPASMAMDPSFGIFVQAVAVQLTWVATLAIVLRKVWLAGLARWRQQGL